jgi:peptide/nickel transport system substrate-binding protein
MLTVGWAHTLKAQTGTTGEMVWAWHVTLARSWFDPAETPPQIIPFGLLYALHDALVHPMAGEKMGNSLAESWTESPDGWVYEFKLRPGLRFHNGDPCTPAEDVQFSFARYKGTEAKALRTNVARVEVIDPLTVRFHLKEPWLDFHLL